MKIVKPLYIVAHGAGIISNFNEGTNVFDSAVNAQKWINENPVLSNMQPMNYYDYVVEYNKYVGTKEEFYNRITENWDLYKFHGDFDWWINPNVKEQNYCEKEGVLPK